MYVYPGGFPEWQKLGYPVEVLKGFVPQVEVPAVSPEGLKAMLESGEKPVLLVISDKEDIAQSGRIAGTTHIPLVDLMARHAEITREAKVVIVDIAGKQSLIAGRYLVKQGYAKVSRLDGGIKAWAAAGYPVER